MNLFKANTDNKRFLLKCVPCRLSVIGNSINHWITDDPTAKPFVGNEVNTITNATKNQIITNERQCFIAGGCE